MLNLWEERLQLRQLLWRDGGEFTQPLREEREGEREKERGEKERGEKERGTRRTRAERSYAVIWMVRPAAAVSGVLVERAPSGSALVELRLRTPSVEPTLEAEWVLERTSRVIPTVGTGGGGDVLGAFRLTQMG